MLISNMTQYYYFLFFYFNVLVCFFLLAIPRVFILFWRTYVLNVYNVWYMQCIEPLNDNENRKGHSLEFIYPKYNTYTVYTHTHTRCVLA